MTDTNQPGDSVEDILSDLYLAAYTNGINKHFGLERRNVREATDRLAALAQAPAVAAPVEAVTFEQAWAVKIAEGYCYGRDALENVQFGWELRNLYLDWQNPPDASTRGGRSVTLTGEMLKDALDFVAPDATDDQRSEEVVIQWSDAGHSGPGYYCHLVEYPDEGAVLLGPEPPTETKG